VIADTSASVQLGSDLILLAMPVMLKEKASRKTSIEKNP